METVPTSQELRLVGEDDFAKMVEEIEQGHGNEKYKEGYANLSKGERNLALFGNECGKNLEFVKHTASLFPTSTALRRFMMLTAAYMPDGVDFKNVDWDKIKWGMDLDKAVLRKGVEEAKINLYPITPFNASSLLGEAAFVKFVGREGNRAVYENTRNSERYAVDFTDAKTCYESAVPVLQVTATLMTDVEYYACGFDRELAQIAMSISEFYTVNVEGVYARYKPRQGSSLPPGMSPKYVQFGTLLLGRLAKLVQKMGDIPLNGAIPETNNTLVFVYWHLTKIDALSLTEMRGCSRAAPQILESEVGNYEKTMDEKIKKYFESTISNAMAPDVQFQEAKIFLEKSRTWRQNSAIVDHYTNDLMIGGYLPHIAPKKWGILSRVELIDFIIGQIRIKNPEFKFFRKLVLIGSGSDLLAKAIKLSLSSDPNMKGHNVEIYVCQSGNKMVVPGCEYPIFDVPKKIEEIFKFGKGIEMMKDANPYDSLVMIWEYDLKLFDFQSVEEKGGIEQAIDNIIMKVPHIYRGILSLQHELCDKKRFLGILDDVRGKHQAIIKPHPRKHNSAYSLNLVLNSYIKEEEDLIGLINERSRQLFNVILNNKKRNHYSTYGWGFDEKAVKDQSLLHGWSLLIALKDSFKQVKKQGKLETKGDELLEIILRENRSKGGKRSSVEVVDDKMKSTTLSDKEGKAEDKAGKSVTPESTPKGGTGGKRARK